MRRDALVTETAEVDDPPYALAPRHPCEVERPLALALLKALTAGHRVDQEVGHIDLTTDTLEARRSGHIASMQLAAVALQMLCPSGIAHQATNIRAGASQRTAEAT